MKLAELKLEDIPGLTDEQCDGLYEELSGFPVNQFHIRHCAHVTLSRRTVIEAGIECDEITQRGSVCHPDSPASVLEGLPAMVEMWTGQRIAWTATAGSEPGTAIVWMNSVPAHPELSIPRGGGPYVRAHFDAAFAACVALGRRE